MGSFKKTAVLPFLIFLSGFLFAQQPIVRTSHKVDYRIPYRTADSKVYDNGKSILREMAKDVLREPWLVRVNVSCELGLAIEKEGDRFQLLVSLDHPAIHGDTVFRHFQVADVLFPSHISMKLRWANRADTSGFTEGSLGWKPVSLSDSMICVLPVAPFDPEVDTLMVREVELSYDSGAVKKFFERIELIHDYYASVALLDSLQRFTGSLRLENTTVLPFNYLKIEEMCRVLDRIDARDFQGKLLQNGFDPSRLTAKYSQLYKDSRSLVFNFMDELHKVGAIPWDGKADQMAGYFTSRVYSYVRRSFLMDQQQGLIYQDCLDHFFDQSGFPPEENIMTSMLAKMFPDAKNDTIAQYISQRIYASYNLNAQELIDQSHYAEAFSMMENRRRFVAANPFMKGTSPDDVLQSRAAQGICDSYVGIASTCIRSHKFNMADSYLSKAGRYVEEHAKYIRSDSSYRAVFSELFFLRNVDCDQLLDDKKYAEALDCYLQFEKSYSPRDLALVSSRLDEKKSMARIGLSRQSEALSENALKRNDADTALYYYEQARTLRQEVENPPAATATMDALAPVMARIKYKQVFQEGAVALEKRQYTLAVNLLKQAKTLADSNGIARGREFDSIYRQAMKNLLIVQLSASQKKIWANQFDSAQMALQRTETTGYDFGLLNDPDFTAATDHYKLKIREQQCRNLQDSVDLRMIRADRNIALKNFVNTMVYLQQAIAFARSMPECNIPVTPLNDTLARYLPAAGYQQKQADARSLVASGNYAEAVGVLEVNQQAFRDQHLGRFGLVMEDMNDFTRERGNPYLTEQVIKTCIGKEDVTAALRYLLLAYDQGLPASNVAVTEVQLGRKFAGLDYLEDPKGDPFKKVAGYIPDNKWFEKFRMAYTGEWNRLGRAGNNGGK
jgi:hypothetical protein